MKENDIRKQLLNNVADVKEGAPIGNRNAAKDYVGAGSATEKDLKVGGSFFMRWGGEAMPMQYKGKSSSGLHKFKITKGVGTYKTGEMLNVHPDKVDAVIRKNA